MPRILLLDEPTSGLDPLMEQVFRDGAREAVDRGATILLSSHILSEVEALCQKVTIIRDGRTVDTGAVDEMRHLSRTSITAEPLGDPGDLRLIPGVTNVTIDGSTSHCRVDNDDLGRLIRLLGDTGVRSLISSPPTLEELFLRHYRGIPRRKTGPHPSSRSGHDHDLLAVPPRHRSRGHPRGRDSAAGDRRQRARLGFPPVQQTSQGQHPLCDGSPLRAAPASRPTRRPSCHRVRHRHTEQSTAPGTTRACFLAPDLRCAVGSLHRPARWSIVRHRDCG